jgi:hypothetical protein
LLSAVSTEFERLKKDNISLKFLLDDAGRRRKWACFLDGPVFNQRYDPVNADTVVLIT